jgi:hypothetical protein
VKALAVWVLEPYQNDELFLPASRMNRDNCLAPFHALKRELENKGWTCHTQDYFLKQNLTPTDVLFLDMPKASVSSILGTWAGSVQSHLLIQECEVVISRNWDLTLHNQFKSISTWSPELMKLGGRYGRANFAQEFRPVPRVNAFEKRKFCTLIAGNKSSPHPLELYSARLNAIRFFERTRPTAFDLYGMGWDRITQSNLLSKVLGRIPFVKNWLAPNLKSYRGSVKDKHSTLQNYRFAICFENARDIPGYVTEKIFDCLMAGCVPVYWGAPDIHERIPKACFIDFRSYKSFDELLVALDGWTANEFEQFLTATEIFFKSPGAQAYRSDVFARALADQITSGGVA